MKHGPKPGYHAEEFGRALTPRQIEIIKYVCQGLSSQQIADLLGIKLGTVKIHIFNAMTRMGVSNRTHLAVEFLKAEEIEA